MARIKLSSSAYVRQVARHVFTTESQPVLWNVSAAIWACLPLHTLFPFQNLVCLSTQDFLPQQALPSCLPLAIHQLGMSRTIRTSLKHFLATDSAEVLDRLTSWVTTVSLRSHLLDWSQQAHTLEKRTTTWISLETSSDSMPSILRTTLKSYITESMQKG